MPRRPVYRSEDQDRPVHKKHGVLYDVRMHFKTALQEFKDFMNEAFPEPTEYQKQEHDKYVKKVEDVYKVINEKLKAAESRFYNSKNPKEAAKEVGRMIHGCVKALQVAMVKGAEEIGLLDMARAAGVVKSDPIKIMEKLEEQVKNIGPRIAEEFGQATGEAVGKATKSVKKGVQKVREKGSELLDDVKSGFKRGFQR